MIMHFQSIVNVNVSKHWMRRRAMKTERNWQAGVSSELKSGVFMPFDPY
jgi:hypothetical protein